MKVYELIEVLKTMPQDADVYRLNKAYEYGYTDSEEFVYEVKKEDEYSVLIM